MRVLLDVQRTCAGGGLLGVRKRDGRSGAGRLAGQPRVHGVIPGASGRINRRMAETAT